MKVSDIADYYGEAHQIAKAIEEAGELATALARYQQSPTPERLAEVVTEAADVSIMVEQLAYLLGIADAIAQERERKIVRQFSRIEAEQRTEPLEVSSPDSVFRQAFEKMTPKEAQDLRADRDFFPSFVRGLNPAEVGLLFSRIYGEKQNGND